MRLRRLQASETVSFLAYLLGLRGARSNLLPDEKQMLLGYAGRSNVVVEVGVYEGATSLAMRQVMRPGAVLYLVDNFPHGLRAEKLLGFSFNEFVARRQLRAWPNVSFIVQRSVSASAALPIGVEADLIFVDASHSYEAVLEDFLSWAPRLAAGGAIAFHDSRICRRRPDLQPTTGPVRLVEEIRGGRHGAWTVADGCDSTSIVLGRMP